MTTAGSELASMRRKEQKPCAHCGAQFTGLLTARYCSERCKQAAKYRRQAEKSGERKS